MSVESHRKAVAKWKKKQREQGLCVVCGEKATSALYCEIHQKSRNEIVQRWRRRMVELYRCPSCGRKLVADEVKFCKMCTAYRRETNEWR